MRVLIDDHESGIEANTVAEAISAGASIAEDRGRLIVEVVVDGTRLSEQQLDAPQCLELAADEVVLASADRREVICQVFHDAAMALDQVDDLQREAAELIQQDEAGPAMERLAEALTIWSSVQQAVELGTRTAPVDLTSSRSPGGNH